MRKFLYVITCCLLILLGLNIVPAYAGSKDSFFNGEATKAFSTDALTAESIEADLCEFVYGDATEYDDTGIRTDRTSGTDGEIRARDYLVDELKEIFGIPADADENGNNYVTTQEINYKTDMLSGGETTFNVVGAKLTGTPVTDYVVIGAHYDNFYGYSTDLFGDEESKSHGIYDNASGVVGVLNMAKLLQDKTLPFDVYYVFFGAEEIGKYGSLGFYEGFVKTYKGDMKLMINMDSIGNGDNLYMYAAEVDTMHERYFRELSDICTDKLFSFGEEIKKAPANKKVDYMIPSGEIAYSHMGLNSDNSSFMHKGNNVITFFSGAWDAPGTGVFESTKNDNLMHTKNDNITKIKELYGDVFFERIRQVTYLCATALVQDNFVEIMDESSKTSGDYIFFTNSLYANIILAVLLIGGFVLYSHLIKKFRGTEPGGKLEQLKKAVMENNIDGIYVPPEKDVTEIIIDEINESIDKSEEKSLEENKDDNSDKK